MYFPFLRGKQFELLALRELAALPLDPEKISPIIEPVKRDLKSILTAAKTLTRQKIEIQLIVNPEHGDLKTAKGDVLDFIDNLPAHGVTNVVPTFIINSEKDFVFFKSTIVERGYDQSGYSVVQLNTITSTNELSTLIGKTAAKNVFIQINHIFGLKRKYNKEILSYLNDPFVKQKKNADYEQYPDENFSNDYFYFSEEGYKGFADYLTIGGEYIEGGMLPYAVAIHLTYKDPDSEDIRICHFLSDSNDGIEDTAGKFYEALTKLVKFVNNRDLDSLAIRQFKDYYERQAFPGLGIIKKLSIMHHIELVQSLL
ncbi:sce7725 family protein [Dyadobacter sp. 3J3]|uniref:sce7725 family protein n=1 Tax=Dyadobacter sp. 3J3 TaxID=2606600 RepID=UPI00135C9861|nr:sce7725 family protein [Dyadobacter sp. 3J3]